MANGNLSTVPWTVIASSHFRTFCDTSLSGSPRNAHFAIAMTDVFPVRFLSLAMEVHPSEKEWSKLKGPDSSALCFVPESGSS